MNDPIEPTHCSFCGNDLEDANGRVKVVEAGIDDKSLCLCERCIRKAARLMKIELEPEKKEVQEKLKKPAFNPLPTGWRVRSPRELKEYASAYVIGQDKMLVQLSTLFYLHMKRLHDIFIDHVPSDEVMIVPGGLLYGNSGVGKTYSVQKLSEYTGLPVAIMDSSTFTQAGYVGEESESSLLRLIEASGGIKQDDDIEQIVARASCGIVFLDEIDKLAGSLSPTNSTYHGTQVSTIGAQAALLRMVEGADVTIHPCSSKYSGNKKPVIMNTENILWIGAGAFTGIHELIEDESVIGFRSCDRDNGNVIKVMSDVSIQEHFVSYGLMPELVGRLNFTIPLKSLNKNDLLSLMLNSKDSPIHKAVKLFEREGIILNIKHEALEMIASRCFEKGLGGARTITPYIQQNVLMKIMYECFGREDKEVEEVQVYVGEGGEIMTDIKGKNNKQLSTA